MVSVIVAKFDQSNLQAFGTRPRETRTNYFEWFRSRTGWRDRGAIDCSFEDIVDCGHGEDSSHMRVAKATMVEEEEEHIFTEVKPD